MVYVYRSISGFLSDLAFDVKCARLEMYCIQTESHTCQLLSSHHTWFMAHESWECFVFRILFEFEHFNFVLCVGTISFKAYYRATLLIVCVNLFDNFNVEFEKYPFYSTIIGSFYVKINEFNTFCIGKKQEAQFNVHDFYCTLTA